MISKPRCSRNNTIGRRGHLQYENSTKENSTPLEVSDIKLYYGYDPYYDFRTQMTNANGKIRNLVWEELL